MTEIKVYSFTDISPSKEKKVCQNCKYFSKWGVHAGNCCHPKIKPPTNRMDSCTCNKFEAK